MITLELADQAATDAEVLDWAAKFGKRRLYPPSKACA